MVSLEGDDTLNFKFGKNKMSELVVGAWEALFLVRSLLGRMLFWPFGMFLALGKVLKVARFAFLVSWPEGWMGEKVSTALGMGEVTLSLPLLWLLQC